MAFISDLGVGLDGFSHGGVVPAEGEAIAPSSGLSEFLKLNMITRLNFFYMGAVLIGLGTIIFRIRAPKTIQRHRSIEEFFNSELDRASARRLRTMVFTIKRRRPNVASDLIRYAPWLDRDSSPSLSLAYSEAREEQDQQIHADVLSSFFNVESRYCNRKSAFVVFILYVIGISSAAIPGLFFTVQVLLSIFQ
ncbi:hypothetical protein RPE78_05565 [Thioclava litoralis]|uniref:Uncharacterized protein n=1 Tax=Thioclava litoralis TaxID=3076557 RepID=A0ABZ1E115_9RHOB|nr:hypothetical protein RPE78_05565 [Thioclava sp. FTW29]